MMNKSNTIETKHDVLLIYRRIRLHISILETYLLFNKYSKSYVSKPMHCFIRIYTFMSNKTIQNCKTYYA